jgi:endonuclease III
MPKHKIDTDPTEKRVKVSFSTFMTQSQYDRFEEAVKELGLFVSKAETIEHIKLELIEDKTDPAQMPIPDVELPKKRGRSRKDFTQ